MPTALPASGTSEVSVIPGTELTSIAYGCSSSLSIKSILAIPRHPHTENAFTAISCIFLVNSALTGAGIICEDAPALYFVS